ncbi:MAG: protein kinase [Phycisphaerales bacterium]|nr:MAG: protein kinase [Phycisphaerales bacterium]
MSGPEEIDDKRPHENGKPRPTDFSSSRVRPGSRIGPFRIEKEVSHGPMGMVYLAHDTKLDRRVAIKSLPVEVMSDALVRARFQREARLLASLNHPNIATIYEEIEEADGLDYLVLEYIPGETLAERIDRGGIGLEETLSIALQIAEAVSAAHTKGVVHRDLKPANIKITPEGKVKVLDFGIAKLVGPEISVREVTAVTQPGQVVGTPGYMSPEQARGKATDHRSDIWSFGCILYEMLAGTRPFPGQTTSDMLASVLTAEPDWEALPAEVPMVLRDLISQCLQKNPERRYQSAIELYQDLLNYQKTLTTPAPKAMDPKALLLSLRKPRVAISSLIIFLALCIAIFWLIKRSAKVRWARVEAIPEIVRLIEQDKYLAAFFLARQAERYIPKDPMFVKLWPRISSDITIITTPAGADIFFKEYSAIDSQWQYLGISPLENIRFPHGAYRWEIRKKGFETWECVAGGREAPTDAPRLLEVDLHEEGSLPLGMNLIRAEYLKEFLDFDSNADAAEASAYLIDKYEVTNKQFKEFVDHGGYEKQGYWKHEFVKDGRELSWEQAMKEFRDKTGRPGPSTWEGGAYLKGQENHPVSGISWYEAAAYAEFVGKSLPTTHHWLTASCNWEAMVIVPFSNFEGDGPAPVGSHPGMGTTGLYDMAGNVKEWCFNATDDSPDHRCILGGAWGEQTYMFNSMDTRSVWDRSPVNGFRCVQYPDGKDSVPDSLFHPVERRVFRDYSIETPASDEEFESYKKFYDYDQTALNAVVEKVDESSDYWRKEKITLNAAYDGDRMIAYLFLPKGIKPPYQTVVYFPGGTAHRNRPFTGLEQSAFTEFVIMSGRALLFPVYKGTYERQLDGKWPNPRSKPIAHRDYVIQYVKDLRRSIDYLESRDDIDSERIAYYGMSWGAVVGPIEMAVEDRIKTGILVVGGLGGGQGNHPAADPFNFIPRVRIPVLMVNGREDWFFPLETSQKVMFELFGTPDEDKAHIVYPGGHGILGLFSTHIRGDVLGWLDRYLGPVD